MTASTSTCTESIVYRRGWECYQQAQAAQLFEDAAGPLWQRAIPSADQRLACFRSGLNVGFALSASCAGRLVGLVGFQTVKGGMMQRVIDQLAACQQGQGLMHDLRAQAVAAFYAPRPGQLLIDGLAVAHLHRGHGIGGQLLQRLDGVARQQGATTLRLQVIDSQPQVGQLAAQHGFVTVAQESLADLTWLLGFGGVTTMEKTVTGVIDK